MPQRNVLRAIIGMQLLPKLTYIIQGSIVYQFLNNHRNRLSEYYGEQK